MIIKGLEFDCTCHGFPEQYDVKDSDGKIVGYVRLRWGCFRVDYPECGEETLLEADLGGFFRGRFDDDRERTRWLTIAADAIISRMAK